MSTIRARDGWAEWRAGPSAYSLGVEEEVMLLDPDGWALSQASDAVLPALDPSLAAHTCAETHASALELATGVHATVAEATGELTELRHRLAEGLEHHGLRAAAAGTHPFTTWRETVTSGGERYRMLFASLRELARREPTFALHVHVGVPDADDALAAMNRLRDALPLLLAASASSPFWQGRDSGLASVRTSLFQAFPRSGTPRAFASYAQYVRTVSDLIECEAIPEATHLWWDVRLQPRFGTIEIRVMDVQGAISESAALVALVQCLVKREVEAEGRPSRFADCPEMLAENRFLAARDGVDARLIEPGARRLMPLAHQLEELVESCLPHARELGCRAELAGVPDLVRHPSPARQRAVAAEHGVRGVVAVMADRFLMDRPPAQAPRAAAIAAWP